MSEPAPGHVLINSKLQCVAQRVDLDRFVESNATFSNISVISWRQFYWWRKPEHPEKTTDLNKMLSLPCFARPFKAMCESQNKNIIFEILYIFTVTLSCRGRIGRDQCFSPLKLWLRTQFMTRCTRYNRKDNILFFYYRGLRISISQQIYY
jgi:hypothetical protein